MKRQEWDEKFAPFLVLAMVPALIEGAAHLAGKWMEIREARRQREQDMREEQFWDRLEAAMARPTVESEDA